MAESKPIVVVTEPMDERSMAYLAEHAEVRRIEIDDLDEHIAVADGLVVRTYTLVTPELLERAERLKVVGRAGVALDNIDVPACRARGVEVVHTPAANTLAVVDYTVRMMIELNRRFWPMTGHLTDKEFLATRKNKFGRYLSEMTLGIIGVGRIGSRVGRAAAGLGMTVLYNDILDVELDEFDRIWAANVRGLFYLSQIVARSMAVRGRGAIVHVSSILARLAVPERSAYCATKGAVESLTRAMALDLADTGIRVNAVAPGLIATDALLAGMPDPELQAAVQRHIPGGRFGRPEEVARVIVFLASDEAHYVNGSVIPVDAGLGGREAGPL